MKVVLAVALAVVVSVFAAPSPMPAPARGVLGVTAPADACGVRPLKPDGTRWRCTFDDEFDGATLDRTRWVPQTIFATGGPTGGACYLDNPATIGVADGALDLTVRKLSRPVTCATGRGSLTTRYVGGMVSTYHLFSQQYGRFEARVKTQATSVPGLHEAFWMWPDDRYSPISWPGSGEIDVSETYSLYAALSVPFLHYSADTGGPQPGVNTAHDCTAPRGVWNTYTLVWGPRRLEILVNGSPCLVNTSGDPAFQKRYILALTAGLGSGRNGLIPQTPLPATTSVDYVRAWR
jgi:beta-glucanase (GH16 family)